VARGQACCWQQVSITEKRYGPVHLAVARPWQGQEVICARIPWVPLDSMPLGCNGHALLFAHLAAIEDIKRLGRQPL